VVTTETFVTGTAIIDGVHICVQPEGELALPASAYICNIDVVNSGKVSGVTTMTECGSGGGYYDGADPDTSPFT
jgi:hypothetical protein